METITVDNVKPGMYYAIASWAAIGISTAEQERMADPVIEMLRKHLIYQVSQDGPPFRLVPFEIDSKNELHMAGFWVPAPALLGLDAQFMPVNIDSVRELLQSIPHGSTIDAIRAVTLVHSGYTGHAGYRLQCDLGAPRILDASEYSIEPSRVSAEQVAAAKKAWMEQIGGCDTAKTATPPQWGPSPLHECVSQWGIDYATNAPRFGLFFRWYDLWVGAYWDRKMRRLYVCPLPMIGFWVRFR